MATASVMTKNVASVLVVSTDAEVRARLRAALTAQRWEVYEADGGAAAMLVVEQTHPQATLFEGALPDLHLEDFAEEVRASHPAMDLIALDGALAGLTGGAKSPRRGELLQVLRSVCGRAHTPTDDRYDSSVRSSGEAGEVVPLARRQEPLDMVRAVRVPELIGDSDRMLEVSRRIRLVARRGQRY